MNGYSFLKRPFFPHIQHASGFSNGSLLIDENFLFLFTTEETGLEFAILSFLMVALDLTAFYFSSLSCLVGVAPDTPLAAANSVNISSLVHIVFDLIGATAILDQHYSVPHS